MPNASKSENLWLPPRWICSNLAQCHVYAFVYVVCLCFVVGVVVVGRGSGRGSGSSRGRGSGSGVANLVKKTPRNHGQVCCVR